LYVPKIALAHDYLTQRGGAERVALSLTRAFPGAALHTSLYEPDDTYPEFEDVDVRPSRLNAVGSLRRRHRLALPFLAPAFSRLLIDADVAVCSSSGWAHGAHVRGRKIVYCHTPARWLYQTDRYLRGRGVVQHAIASSLRPWLARWDRAAAASADRYLANSSVVAERVARQYGIDAEVVSPPPAVTPTGPASAVDGLEAGYVLCVSRLLPYKNVDAVVGAFSQLPGERLVVAGNGPDEAGLRRLASSNITFVGRVDDAQLRWLYARSSGLVAASHEDFGLTPLEAATFGKPSAVLRWGGFLDTVEEGRTGIFFDAPETKDVARAVRELRAQSWDETAIREHAERFSEARFIDRIRVIVAEATR
jgi:glycosyltransferase involved in cell wall biosynthesis